MPRRTEAVEIVVPADEHWEPNPFVVDEADVDSANREILTVEEDDVDDDDVEIDN